MSATKVVRTIGIKMDPVLSNIGRRLLDRRGFLGHAARGLGSVALLNLLNQDRLLAAESVPPTFSSGGPIRPLIRPDAPSAPRGPHFAPKAKRVLVIFCSGAVSHLDTFDYKPELVKRDGQPMPGLEHLVTFQGANGNLAAPRWQFRPRGQTGKMTSDLLPRLGAMVDDLCFIHSMTAKSNTHGPAENQMGSGFTLEGYPTMGAWVTYALGSESSNLPAFVAIPDPRGVPQTGPSQWSAGFLPAVFQGTPFSADKPIAHLARPKTISPDADGATRDFLRLMNDEHLRQNPGDNDLAARIASYELAGRMQLSAAEVGNLSGESAATRALYGVDDPNPTKAGFARNCLLARRLLERDVRFVQLFNGSYAMGEGVGNWDGHKALHDQYNIHGPVLDQPAAGLIADLKQRGMLDDTLVAWVTEFGRMPTFQAGASGRDHNPKGFTVFFAGAGVKKGFSYGQTDEFGYKAAVDEVTIYDFHATMLHILGLDHERLSFYHNGIERRLTDVHGHVIAPILA